jgi:branched-chain amino acid transport system permease protein
MRAGRAHKGGKTIGIWLVLACGAMLASTVWVADNYALRLSTMACLMIALALSWNIIGGYAGYPSFATAAFFGFGAYAGAILQTRGVPLVLAWPAATLMTGAIAAAIGVAVLRLKGHYFAVGSFAVLQLFQLAASSWISLTGGGSGLNVPILSGGPEHVARFFLLSALGLALIVFAVAAWVDRSPLGFGLKCIRQNESATNMLGADVGRLKLAGFILSTTFVGSAGAIYASWISYIDPSDMFSIVLTIKVPVMVMLGGAGTLFGPIAGVAIFQILEERIWANFIELHRGLLGIVIIILVFVMPGGVMRIRVFEWLPTIQFPRQLRFLR